MFSFKWKESDLDRIKKALDRVRAVASSEAENLPMRLASDYSRLLMANILSKKFSFAPYNLQYALWKRKVGLFGKGFWNLTGDLLSAITYYKVSSRSATGRFQTQGWFAGVRSGVMDSGRKSWYGNLNKGKPKEIAAYGWIMEAGGTFGNQTHPARPMLALTLQEFRSAPALSQLNVTAERIKRVWV